MRIIRKLADIPAQLRNGAVAVGNFDGVHRGHARIIKRLLERAQEVNGPAVVFTFDPHPVRLLRPEHAPPPLTWTERKAQLLSELGVHSMIAYPTDDELLALTPHEFFERIVCHELSARAIVEGPNFYFGRGRSGDIGLLSQLCRQRGVTLDIVQAVRSGTDFVSSSRVRKAIENGDVTEARRMLIRPYRIRGMVTHGSARGARIGFPTANLDAVDTLVPADGVYAGRAYSEGKDWLAAIHVGSNPTFGERNRKVEVHLIDFESTIYGQPLEVDFLSRLRDIHPFKSPEELREQLARDVASVRQLSLQKEDTG